MPEPLIKKMSARPGRVIPKNLPPNILKNMTATHPQTNLDVLRKIGHEHWDKILELTKQQMNHFGIASVLEDFIIDESSGGDLQPRDIIKITAVFFTLMQSSILSAEAKSLSPSDQKKIEWILEMSNKPEVIDILINQSEKPGQAKEDHKLSEEDKNLLAWNIFHEARGEGPTGQKLVMLATVNRMFSNKYPPSLKGVVLQRMQFSWANNLINQENYLGRSIPSKSDEADYIKIREEIERIFSGRGLRSAQERIISDIILDPELDVPSGFNWNDITSYHKYKMLEIPKLFEQTAVSTRKRIEEVEKNWNLDRLNILTYRNHIFHTDKYNK